MTALRILNLIAWGAVLLYMAPALLDILRGRIRAGDPARLVCAAFALQVMGFNVRWLAIPESQAVWLAQLALSIVLALFTIKVARTYGRGDHVG